MGKTVDTTNYVLWGCSTSSIVFVRGFSI